MKHIKVFFMIIGTMCMMATLPAGSNQQVIDVLELTKRLHGEEIFIGDALRTISNASFYEANYGLVLSDQNEDMFLTRYFIKDKDTLSFFHTGYEAICSKEFIHTIRPEFSLQSIEDGLVFQKFLFAVDDNYFNYGFFIDGNTWIFVRDVFFGDIEAFLVETDEHGTITDISYEYC